MSLNSRFGSHKIESYVFLINFLFLTEHFVCLFLLSNLRFGVHYLVSHWGPSWVWPHVIWLLPLFWVGGHYFQPARWIHRHLLIRFLLVSLLPGEQPFLLLQTGRQQPTSCALHQSCQKRPRLRLEIKPMWIVDSSGLYIETYPRVLIYPRLLQ